MAASKKFSLKWNDFESNVVSFAFRELRDDRLFRRYASLRRGEDTGPQGDSLRLFPLFQEPSPQKFTSAPAPLP